jgi:integrase/recombinase XerD
MIVEYEKELHMMIQQLLEYSDGKLIWILILSKDRFLKTGEHGLHRYQKWVTEESPHVEKRGSYSLATLERKTMIWKSFFMFLYWSGHIEKPNREGLLAETVQTHDRQNCDLGPGKVIQQLNYFDECQQYIVFSIIGHHYPLL